MTKPSGPTRANLLENPVVYVGGIVVAIVAAAADWIAPEYALIVAVAGVVGLVLHFRKRSGTK